MSNEKVETWSAELVAEQYAFASPLMKRLQQALAARPDQEVSAEELATLLAVGKRQIAGATGAFARDAYRRWRMNAPPFAVRRDYAGDQTYYSMPSEAARIVKRAGSERGPSV